MKVSELTFMSISEDKNGEPFATVAAKSPAVAGFAPADRVFLTRLAEDHPFSDGETVDVSALTVTERAPSSPTYVDKNTGETKNSLSWLEIS